MMKIIYNMIYRFIIIHVFQYKLFIILTFYPIILLIFIFENYEFIKILPQMGNNLLLVNTFLSIIFSLEDIFEKSSESGDLELFMLLNHSLEIIIFLQCFIHWILYGPSLIFFAYILLYILNINIDSSDIYNIMIISFYLTILGFMGTSLLIGLKQRIFLLYLMIFPLMIPYIIFSHHIFQINFILFFSIFMIFIHPFITSFILRKNMT